MVGVRGECCASRVGLFRRAHRVKAGVVAVLDNLDHTGWEVEATVE